MVHQTFQEGWNNVYGKQVPVDWLRGASSQILVLKTGALWIEG